MSQLNGNIPTGLGEQGGRRRIAKLELSLRARHIESQSQRCCAARLDMPLKWTFQDLNSGIFSSDTVIQVKQALAGRKWLLGYIPQGYHQHQKVPAWRGRCAPIALRSIGARWQDRPASLNGNRLSDAMVLAAAELIRAHLTCAHLRSIAGGAGPHERHAPPCRVQEEEAPTEDEDEQQPYHPHATQEDGQDDERQHVLRHEDGLRVIRH